ncbi:MAG TPA: four helix bundle protein [Lentisphaeria bacterium]|nr:MAG: four helix bundle protein [Lentisphaerae bacterium GWF2_50_93]HCE42906.1 four helix bundle protein [Lentisphaeria bacterium]
MNRKNFDLEERLIAFACSIVKVVEMMPRNLSGNHFSGQLIRSGTSPALNYAEARDAESKNDFIHKMKIVLKELRETYVCLKIIDRQVFPNSPEIKEILVENNELISIFVKSISTARK